MTALRVVGILGWWLLAWASSAPAIAAQKTGRANGPVALVVAVQGSAQVRAHPGVRSSSPLMLGEEVAPGQEIAVAAGRGAALTLAWYKSSARYRLTAGARAVVTPAGLRRIAGPAPQRLPTPGARISYNRQDVRRPREGGLMTNIRSADLSPVLTRMNAPLGAILETRPRFSWNTVPAPDNVVIAVYPLRDPTPLWQQQFPGNTATAQYPADKPALAPGQLYRWVVTVPSDGIQPESKAQTIFWVAAPSVRQNLEALRAEVRAHPEDPALRVLLLRALWDAGFFAEAATTAEAFARTQPGDTALAGLAARLHKLLDCLASGRLDPIHTQWSTQCRE
ncbi:MAG TPA: hypothetical protein VFB38_02615 [Chthonomonadaceae bacterium]|nr:hypothetical protein [Chthonomonadaceae bacterium]